MQLKNISFTAGDISVTVAQVANPEKLFNDLLEKDPSDDDVADERMPYYAELWPSAIALSEFLVENSSLIKDKHVVEIGCGLALPGIVAAKLGAKVLLTDYLTEALKIAQHNWKLNIKGNADTLQLDWREVVNIKPFDVLIASDIAYEQKSFKPLVVALKKLIRENGTIIISEPNRKYAQKFFSGLRSEGFSVESQTREVMKDGIKYKIFIHLIKPA